MAHCGAASTPRMVDAAQAACEVGVRILRRGGRALDAAIEATVVLEDDPRTNAGIGSRMKLDGRVQMDAGVMASDLRTGAVAAIEGVRNPVRVARAVMDTPHILLAGGDATRFARHLGFRRFDPATPESRERWEVTVRRIRAGDVPPRYRKLDRFAPLGTVGAVARDRRGRFAATSSTGGTTFMLPGRVGDTPLIGSGFYAGPAGAVTTTGQGEEIARHVLAKRVYDLMADGTPAERAARRGLKPFKRSVIVGILAVDRTSYGEACNRDMAWWASDRVP